MGIENNPIYRVALKAEEAGLSEEQALELADSEQCGARTKRIKNKHVIKIIRHCWARDFQSAPEDVPRFLLSLTLHCANRYRVKEILISQLHMLHGASLMERLRLQEARQHLIQAKRMSSGKRNQTLILLIETLLANMSFLTGHPGESSDMRKQARLKCGRRGNFKGNPWGQLKMAQIFLNLGEYENALESFELAKNLFNRSSFISEQMGIFLCELGLHQAYFELGSFDRAMESIDSMQHKARKLGLHHLVSSLDDMQAMAAGFIGEHTRAINILEAARRSHEQNGDWESAFTTEIRLGDVFRRSGDHQRALDVLKEVLDKCEKAHMEPLKARCLMALASTYREMGEPVRALEYIESSRKIYVHHGVRWDLISCEMEQAWCFTLDGRYQEALELLTHIREALHYRVPSLVFLELAHVRGFALTKMGRWEEAREAYESAIELIEGIREGLSDTEHRATFLETMHRIYYEMIGLCLDQWDIRNALEYIERMKSRTLAEMLFGRDLLPKNASEEDIYAYRVLRSQLRSCAYRIDKAQNPEQALTLREEMKKLRGEHDSLVACLQEEDPSFDPDQSTHITCEDIESLVKDTSSALVELFPMEGRTVVFIVRAGRPVEQSTIFIKDYDRSSLESDVTEIEEKRNPREKDLVLRRVLKRLHERIFEPIETHLHGIEHVIFIPYSGFHLIPLHAMFKEVDGQPQYVIDKRMVTYAPSAKILKQCLQRERLKTGRVVTATADPKGDLYYAGNEAERVGSLFNGSEAITRATKEEVIRGGLSANIFHYAGHAHARALWLHAQDNPRKGDYYDIGEMFVNLDMPETYLATLSACDTGKTRLANLDEYVGVTSAFLNAGASRVVCSLWPVDDKSTGLLMTKMYESINEGQTPARALWRAQLWLRDCPKEEIEQKLRQLGVPPGRRLKGLLRDALRWRPTRDDSITLMPEDLSSPYYWAGFICSGAP